MDPGILDELIPVVVRDGGTCGREDGEGGGDMIGVLEILVGDVSFPGLFVPLELGGTVHRGGEGATEIVEMDNVI